MFVESRGSKEGFIFKSNPEAEEEKYASAVGTDTVRGVRYIYLRYSLSAIRPS